MAPRCQVRVQKADFDPGREIEALRTPACGAIVSFVGVARDFSADAAVERIHLEHYPGMTERSLLQIAQQAVARWDLQQVCIIHRVGEILAGDRIVLVATASVHRDAAFDGCRFVIDYLKHQAPFWKRESGAAGTRWVEARPADAQAPERWRDPAAPAAPAPFAPDPVLPKP